MLFLRVWAEVRFPVVAFFFGFGPYSARFSAFDSIRSCFASAFLAAAIPAGVYGKCFFPTLGMFSPVLVVLPVPGPPAACARADYLVAPILSVTRYIVNM